jgi:hypothetical protein
MPLILGANSLAGGGYEVDNSLRFNRGSADHLTRSVSGSSTTKATYSVWFKKTINGVEQCLYAIDDVTNEVRINFTTSDTIQVFHYAGGYTYQVATNRVFRDPSAFYNIMIVVDTTQGTDTNRVKIYVNGVQETSLATTNYPSQNTDSFFFQSATLYLGVEENGSSNPIDGYIAENIVCQGQALTPTDVGEFDEDSGIWKPIDVSGLTFGTNGFYLEFKDSSALGDDTSGNGNDFTVNNLTSVDQSTDTCTNNFATFNSLDNTLSQYTFSDGNLTGVYSGSNGSGVGTTSTLGVSSGKWYWEFKYTSANDTPLRIGITDRVAISTASTYRCGFGLYDWIYNQSDGNYYNNNSGTAYGDTFTTGNIIGVALDLDNNKLYFSKNGVFQNSGDPTSGATGTGAISITDPSSTNNGFYFAVVGMNSGSGTFTGSYNFGNPPFAITTGNEDANGYGNFEYEVPPGYYSLCTNNLAEYG